MFTDQICKVSCVDILGKLVFGMISDNLKEPWGKWDKVSTLYLSIFTV